MFCGLNHSIHAAPPGDQSIKAQGQLKAHTVVRTYISIEEPSARYTFAYIVPYSYRIVRYTASHGLTQRPLTRRSAA